jgi:hypothetical protein
MYSYTPNSKRLETFLSVSGIPIPAVAARVNVVGVTSFVQPLILLISGMKKGSI